MNGLVQILVLVCLLGCALCADRRWCNSQADCHSNKCCISNNPPRGKRILTNGHLGHCQTLGQTGSACYVNFKSSSTPTTGLTYGCPCESPLHCHGSGMVEVPLGETGTCG